jgi:hypothetical protein
MLRDVGRLPAQARRLCYVGQASRLSIRALRDCNAEGGRAGKPILPFAGRLQWVSTLTYRAFPGTSRMYVFLSSAAAAILLPSGE